MTIQLQSINSKMTEENDELFLNGVNVNEVDFNSLDISEEDIKLVWNTFKYDVSKDDDEIQE